MAEWEKVADIAVDAGLIWVGDPGYTMTPDSRWAIATTWTGFVTELDKHGYHEHGIARFPLPRGVNGDLGVAIESGEGDGVYPVYIRRDPETNRVAELRVTFLEDTPSN